MAALKYTFKAGLFSDARNVTVVADTEEEAREKASVEMDRRYAKRNEEPPVAWTFVLLHKKINWAKPKKKNGQT